MIVVPDAGPLIYLAGSGHLDLLRELYAEVVVPRVVYDEVTIAGRGMVGADEVRAATSAVTKTNRSGVIASNTAS